MDIIKNCIVCSVHHTVFSFKSVQLHWQIKCEEPARGSSPDHVSDVPVGFRGQRTDDLHTIRSYYGDLILKQNIVCYRDHHETFKANMLTCADASPAEPVEADEQNSPCCRSERLCSRAL